MNLLVLRDIFLFGFILSFLVVIHELGHFIAARWAKVKIEEFGIGFPPLLAKLFTYKGTPFVLNWIPIGGYVRMEGEDALPEERAPKVKKNMEGPFYAKPAFDRLVVVLAGVVVNFLFGIVAFSIVYTLMGIPEFINAARIEIVGENTPAAQAGIPTNVNIIAIRDGDEVVPVSTNEEAREAVNARRGKEIVIVTTGPCVEFSCQESAQEFSTYIRTEAETPEGQGALGIGFAEQVLVKYPWYQQIPRGIFVGVVQALFFGKFVLESLAHLVTQLVQFGQVPQDLAGPVGIVDQAHQQGLFNQGWLMVLNFMALLSVNLAIMNLLPIPALDGGRAVFILLEKIIGRHRIEKVEGYANYAGFIVLIGLILLVTARDVWRLFTT